MNQQGETVYLKASPETLLAHLKIGKTVRPLLLNKTPEEVKLFINEQLAAREPYYLKAHHIMDVNILDEFKKINDAVATLRTQLSV